MKKTKLISRSLQSTIFISKHLLIDCFIYLLSKMTAANFRFNLFDPEFAVILSNCAYINLPFNIANIYSEVNDLLSRCGEFFFEETLGAGHHKRLKECSENAKIILDISWEKINTGHWKDVDSNWRIVFTLATIFKVLCLLTDKNTSKFDIIKACDMGLLMGAPLMQNILTKIAFKISSMIIDEKNTDCGSNAQDCSSIMQVETKKLKPSNNEDLKFSLTVGNIDHLCFKNTYIEKCKPIKLTDCINDWPALSLWSVEYILQKAQFRTVPVEIGSKYTDESWTQKLMTVKNFVDRYIKNKQKEIGYLAQHNLFNQIPELLHDIRIPSHIMDNYGNVDVDISVYFGPAGTISPLHYDPKHNLLAQVFGRKYIRLYSKETTKYLYPRHNTWLNNTSQVDVENPDLEFFPLFEEAPYEECILGPGDLLYIPPGCWHYVRSLDVSISISFWWEILKDA